MTKVPYTQMGILCFKSFFLHVPFLYFPQVLSVSHTLVRVHRMTSSWCQIADYPDYHVPTVTAWGLIPYVVSITPMYLHSLQIQFSVWETFLHQGHCPPPHTCISLHGYHLMYEWPFCTKETVPTTTYSFPAFYCMGTIRCMVFFFALKTLSPPPYTSISCTSLCGNIACMAKQSPSPANIDCNTHTKNTNKSFPTNT